MSVMKILKIIFSALLTLAAFMAGVWLFAPWEDGGLYAFDKVRLASAEKGWYLSYNGFESSGRIFPEYRIRSLDIEGKLLKTSLADVRVRLLPLSSALAGAPVCYLEFAGGRTSLYVLESVLKDIFSHDGGRLWLTLSRKKVKAEGAFVGGDLQVTGDLSYDRGKRAFTENTILIRVPENIDLMMKGVGSQYAGRYLEAAGPGEWRIRENAISN
jgi:hypothetical protein